jgi:hypothetical protein
MSKSPKAYPVGYKKPPASGQFKKGQSGNPSGKKKPKGLLQVLQDQLEAEIAIKANGGLEKRVVKELLITKVIKSALEGDIQFIKLIFQNAAQTDPNGGNHVAPLTDHEIQQLKDLLNAS